MDLYVVLKLLAVLLLVAANGFFVAAEFALVAVHRSRTGETAGEDDAAATQAGKARRDLERSVSGTQLGITLASLGLGWLGEPALARPLAGLFSSLDAPWSGILTHGTAVIIAFALIVFLHVVFGELVPRSGALVRPEAVARVVAAPLKFFNTLMWPFIVLLNGAAGLIARRAGAAGVAVQGRVHSPEQIELLLKRSAAEGIVEEDEEEMIHGVFELTRTVAREVMTPRPDIVAFPEEASLDQVLEVAAESGFSRFPVYRGSIDEVTGVVLVKDLLRWLRRPDSSSFRLPDVMRRTLFCPDTKPVDDLLAEFRRQKVHLAVVVDEFGGTDGVVTLEDLVEEIVGDIFDEHDVAEEEIVLLETGRARVDGGADPSDVIEKFDLGPVQHANEYDTVAGYVIGQLGRIPEQGETVRFGAAELEVVDTQEQRVTTLELRIRRADADVPGSGGGPGER
jgi:CBS domain containing-hemolysin-like protein